MSKNQIIIILITVAECIVFWNVVDFFTVTFISKGTYVFSWMKDLVVPLLVGAGMGFTSAYKNKQ